MNDLQLNSECLIGHFLNSLTGVASFSSLPLANTSSYYDPHLMTFIEVARM